MNKSRRLLTILFFMISLNAWGSFVYWNFGNDVGSSYYWTYGQDVGSQYFWKYDSRPGSEHFWKFGSTVGSEYFWKYGKTSGSKYFWEKSKEPGSKYYWLNGTGPGSKYFWENGETASFGPIYTTLCKGGAIKIAPCALMVDSPVQTQGMITELNSMISEEKCVDISSSPKLKPLNTRPASSSKVNSLGSH